MSALSYQQCYEILALQNHADLAEAESSYRKLVHQWHPDRYQGEDPSEATRRYVEITKAFKKLRDFHKDNKTLPFSSVDDVATNETSSAAEEQNRNQKNNKTLTRPKATSTLSTLLPSDASQTQNGTIRSNSDQADSFLPSARFSSSVFH